MLVALALAALFWAAPAGAATTYRYDVRVTGFAHDHQVGDFGSSDLVMRWTGVWKNVRLKTTFLGRNSLTIVPKPNRAQRGAIRAKLQFAVTDRFLRFSCKGSVQYPRYGARLAFGAFAIKGAPHHFHLMTQLKLAEGMRLAKLTDARQEARCVSDDGQRYAPGSPAVVRRFTGPKRIKVDGGTLLSASFERDGGKLPFPLRPLSRGKKVSYTTGLKRKTIPGDNPITSRYRFTFKFIPRGRG